MITEVNGEPIVRSGELSSLIGMAAPGEKVKLKVWRDKRRARSTPSSAAPTRRRTQVADADAARTQPRPARPGAASADAATSAAGRVDAAAWWSRTSAGPAARAGIQPGDVLLAINGKPVASLDQVKSVLQSKPKSVALLVQRDGDKIFVPVNLG